LKPSSRPKFEELVRRVSGRHLPPNSLYDLFYDFNGQKNWILWEKLVAEYQPPEDGRFSKILVPTVDTKRFSWLLNQFIGLKLPVMFVGESGTAKSVILQSYLNALPSEGFIRLNINFSSRTTSLDIQNTIEDNIDKRSGRIFGPKVPGKTLIIFIDDVHMPVVDTYGTQQPIALLKFLIDKGYIYERGGNLEQKFIKDTQFVAAMLPPGGGTNSVDPRFITLFSCFNILFPSTENVERIYSSIIKAHFKLKNFPEDFQELSQKITQATLRLYNTIVDQLPRSPLKFHYIFNLRDLSRIYEGLCRSSIDAFNSKEKIIRLWRNECLRVFADKLISVEDRGLVGEKTIPDLIKEFFPECFEVAMASPIFVGDFMTANPVDTDALDPKLYSDCGDYESVGAKFKQMLHDYNDDDTHKVEFLSYLKQKYSLFYF
jgi:dynein heavy chain, axonemal